MKNKNECTQPATRRFSTSLAHAAPRFSFHQPGRRRAGALRPHEGSQLGLRLQVLARQLPPPLAPTRPPPGEETAPLAGPAPAAPDPDTLAALRQRLGRCQWQRPQLPATLPAGKDRDKQANDLRVKTDRRDTLLARQSQQGPEALVESELDAAPVDTQLPLVQDLLAQVTAHCATLPA